MTIGVGSSVVNVRFEKWNGMLVVDLLNFINK